MFYLIILTESSLIDIESLDIRSLDIKFSRLLLSSIVLLIVSALYVVSNLSNYEVDIVIDELSLRLLILSIFKTRSILYNKIILFYKLIE